MNERLLDEKAVREVLGIGRTKFYELISTGEIASVKIGRCRRVPETALRDYMESLSAQAAI